MLYAEYLRLPALLFYFPMFLTFSKFFSYNLQLCKNKREEKGEARARLKLKNWRIATSKKSQV